MALVPALLEAWSNVLAAGERGEAVERTVSGAHGGRLADCEESLWSGEVVIYIEPPFGSQWARTSSAL